MINQILDRPLSSWLEGEDRAPHIVISSRIRLARNFKGIIFTNRADDTELERVDSMGRSLLPLLNKADQKEYSYIALGQLSDVERAILAEKHLISPLMTDLKPHRSLIINQDASISIMVNEEDHLRIQAMEPGLGLKAAYTHAICVDDAIESKYSYAFSNQFGYETACPTNVGTGLRASVMLHLPALAMTGKLQRLIRSIVQLGYTVRGLYGEGSEALGHIYQVSNQKTMGISEEETIEQLLKIVDGIVKEEERARQDLYKHNETDLEDRLWRSYGILSYARRIDGQEALSLLSDVQLGIDLAILPKWGLHTFNELVSTTRPNFLCKVAGKTSMTSEDRDRYRAQVIRQKLAPLMTA